MCLQPASGRSRSRASWSATRARSAPGWCSRTCSGARSWPSSGRTTARPKSCRSPSPSSWAWSSPPSATSSWTPADATSTSGQMRAVPPPRVPRAPVFPPPQCPAARHDDGPPRRCGGEGTEGARGHIDWSRQRSAVINVLLVIRRSDGASYYRWFYEDEAFSQTKVDRALEIEGGDTQSDMIAGCEVLLV